jgi:hypothetical protein
MRKHERRVDVEQNEAEFRRTGGKSRIKFEWSESNLGAATYKVN